MENVRFIHLRTHSGYSLSEGAIKAKELSKICIQNNMPAIALTDTNNFFGAPEFSYKCMGDGIQPIIGIVLSFNHSGESETVLQSLRQESLSKIVLLAMNETGFLNLSKLITDAYLRTDYLHLGCFVNPTELFNLSEGVICLSGGSNGPIGKLLLENQLDSADNLVQKFLKYFGDRFYIEIQRHAKEEEIKTEDAFLDFAYKYNIPLVATNDIYFQNREDFEAQDALLCIAAGEKVSNENRRSETPENYFKTVDEMCELFSDLPEAIENTVKIAKRCVYTVTERKPLLPKFCETREEEDALLRKQTMDGLYERLIDNHIPEEERQKFIDQAEYELSVISKMQFPGYFLIVADFIQWSRDHNIWVGPGRGSGAGSVVAWAIKITNVNPLKYGLLFERFLNPERISMPDFDIDFDPDDTPKVVEYVKERYGVEKVSRIINFGSLAPRNVVRDVGRVLGFQYGQCDTLAKLVLTGTNPENNKPYTLKDSLKTEEMKRCLEREPALQQITNIAVKLEGLYRQTGEHAAGVCIGDRNLIELCPLYKSPDRPVPVTQYDKNVVETIGLIKFDFLGLKTLSILKLACELIEKHQGKKVFMDEISVNDPKSIDIVNKGLTVAIFQLESAGMIKTLKEMKPTCFEDISAVIALFRPGPMANIPEFIARKHGESEIKYPHPLSEPVLKETYGILVYQEQIMELSKRLAHFTGGQADTLRKAMGKKKVDIMNNMRVMFINGCKEFSGMTEEESNNLYDLFIEFSKYGFNKSHSIAYAVVTMQTAYLKAYYPTEFFAANMTYNTGDHDQLKLLRNDAENNFDISILKPDINKSGVFFDIVDSNKIIYALSAIKGIGESAIKPVIEERKTNGIFKNITDFITRCAHLVNKRVLESLIKSGALDSLYDNRAQLFMNMDTMLAYASKHNKESSQMSLFGNIGNTDGCEDLLLENMTDCPKNNLIDDLKDEEEYLGFHLSAHPIKSYVDLFELKGLTDSSKINEKAEFSIVQIGAYVSKYFVKKTKLGKDWIKIDATDMAGKIDAVAFGFAVPKLIDTLKPNSIFILTGKISKSNMGDGNSLIINDAISVNDWIANNITKLEIELNSDDKIQKFHTIISSLKRGQTKVEITIKSSKQLTVLELPELYQFDGDAIEQIFSITSRVILK